MRFRPDLFKQEGPPGLSYVPDFISLEEENFLLDRLKQTAWKDFTMYGVSAKRKIFPFGLDYNFSKRISEATAPIPEFLLPILTRSAPLLDVAPSEIKEVLFTYYPIGAGIGQHIDAPPFRALLGISLLNACVMRFQKIGEEKTRKYDLFLERRSAYVIKDEARWKWQHEIKAMREERYSITLRTLIA